MIGYGTVTSRDDVTMTLPNRTASTPSAKSTSVLLTSPTIHDTSRDVEESSVIMTSSIPRLSLGDVKSSYSTMMTSPAAPKKASSILMTSMPSTPSTSHVAVGTPAAPQNPRVVLAVAEVHRPPTRVDSEDLGHDLDNEERFSSASLPYPAGSSGSKVITPSESQADETGSLIFTDEVDSQIYAGNKNTADAVQLPVSGLTQESPLPVSDMKSCDLDSNPPSSPSLSSPPSSLPSPNAPLDPPITAPLSYAGSVTDATRPEEDTSALTGSESALQDPPETKPASTFNFIGWEVGNVADKMADRKCHRVLIFKDREIVLMFKVLFVTTQQLH